MGSSNTRTLGEVREVFHDESTARFEWTIPDCSEFRHGFNSSPAVKYLNTNWTLEIFKNGNSMHSLCLRRELLTPGILESVRFTIGCKKAEGGEENVVFNQTLPEDDKNWGRDILHLFGTPSQGRVTFTCSLRKAQGISRQTQTEGESCSNCRKDEHGSPGSKGVSPERRTEDAHGRYDKTHTEAISSLLKHFKKLLLSGDDHDVVIKVGDKQFRAHKCVLRARSPVFAAMFSNDMAESAEGSVTIEDCDADSFGEFLQFVYSGKADFASASSALGLYYAGDKYDFPMLKEMCVEYLKNSFMPTTVFDVINLAARHNEEELMQQAIVFFANNLEEVMLTVEWQRFLLANPIQANEISLKAVQCRLKTSLYKK